MDKDENTTTPAIEAEPSNIVDVDESTHSGTNNNEMEIDDTNNVIGSSEVATTSANNDPNAMEIGDCEDGATAMKTTGNDINTTIASKNVDNDVNPNNSFETIVNTNDESATNNSVENVQSSVEFFALPHVNIKEEVEIDVLENLLEERGENTSERDEDNDSNDTGHLSNNSISDIFQNCPWYEPIPTTAMCRCRLCNVRVAKTSFNKHLKTQMHTMFLSQSSSAMRIKEEVKDVSQLWNTYADRHPWLMADPTKPDCAYCKYCRKRIFYGFSEIKRTLHENSSFHKKMMDEYNKRQMRSSNNQQNSDASGTRSQTANGNRKRNNEDTDEDDNIDDDNDNDENNDDENNDDDSEDDDYSNEGNDDDDKDSTESDTGSEKSKRLKLGSKDWFSLYPWSQRYIKDKNYMYCSYCDEVLPITASREKHNKSIRHCSAVKKLTNKSSKCYRRLPKNLSVVMAYPWLIYKNNNPGNTICKYCRVRIRKQGSRRHEQSQRHKEAFAAYQEKIKRKMNPTKEKNDSNGRVSPAVSPPAAALATQDEAEASTTAKQTEKAINASMQKNVLLWQSRFPWLSYKKIRPNYAYCELCEIAVYMPSLKYASKHQCSANHIRQRIKLKAQSRDQSSDAKTSKSSSKPTYVWYVPVNRLFGKCKYCDVKVLLQARMRHCMLRDHRMAKQLFEQRQTTAVDDDKDDDDDDDDDKDNNIIEAVNEANGENETTPAANTMRQTEKSLVGPASKKFKDSYNSAVETANRLTDAHFNLLRLTRDLQKASNTSEVDMECESPTGTTALSTKIPDNISVTTSSTTSTSIPSPQPAAAEGVASDQPSQTATVASTSDKMNDSMSFFLLSVEHTVRQLPVDLIAEWKMKVMQIVYDLEIRALRRQQNNNEILDESIVVPSDNTSTSSAEKLANAEIVPVQQTQPSAYANIGAGSAIGAKSNDVPVGSTNTENTIVVNHSENVSKHVGGTFNDVYANSTNVVKFITTKNIGVANSERMKGMTSIKIPSRNLQQQPKPSNNNNSGKHFFPTLPPHIQLLSRPKVFKTPAPTNVTFDGNNGNTADTRQSVCQPALASGIRHIQINSQSNAKVIPLQSWTESPTRRYTVNVSPKQMQILTTLRTSPQKVPQPQTPASKNS